MGRAVNRAFTRSEKTDAIIAVLRTVPLGATMTYKELSKVVGFYINNGNAHYRSAISIVLREGISITAGDPKVSFRRRTAEEMAEGKHRFKPIARMAKRGGFEAREALKSNDLRTQGKASVAAAKYALIAGMKPVSNRDVPSDKI